MGVCLSLLLFYRLDWLNCGWSWVWAGLLALLLGASGAKPRPDSHLGVPPFFLCPSLSSLLVLPTLFLAGLLFLV